jgi:hypothetical protein
VICFHTTDKADAILRNGFRDNTRLVAGVQFTGVFISDQPVTEEEGAKGDQLLQLEFSDDVDLGPVIVGGEPHSWCVPAKLINDYATVTLLTDEERDAAREARWSATFKALGILRQLPQESTPPPRLEQ